MVNPTQLLVKNIITFGVKPTEDIKNKYFIFHSYTNNINISISLDSIFFNKRRMIHHYSISSSEEFVRDTIFKKNLGPVFSL